MAKYKIGDKVKIRKDLNKGEYYNGIYCNHDMASRGGEIVTISYVDKSDNSYYIEEDEDDYFEFAEKIITVQDFINKFITTKNTNIVLYIKDKEDYQVTMGCGNIKDSILYSTFVDAYGRFKVVSISFEVDTDNYAKIALLEVEP